MRIQIAKFKHILIASVLLAILSVPRLVFAFVFVCSKLDQYPFITLPSYLIGFLPSITILFAFILPSQVYRKALLGFIRLIVPESIRNYFLTFRHAEIIMNFKIQIRIKTDSIIYLFNFYK